MRRPARAPLPGDFTRAIVAIENPSGLTWEELALLLGANTLNLWRWRKGVRPDTDRLLLLHTPSRSLAFEHVLPVVAGRDRGPTKSHESA